MAPGWLWRPDQHGLGVVSRLHECFHGLSSVPTGDSDEYELCVADFRDGVDIECNLLGLEREKGLYGSNIRGLDV